MSESNTWAVHRYRVRENRRVTPVICELRLDPVDGMLDFQAGQYVLLSDTDWRVPQRSYSLANAPREGGGVSLLVTRVDEGPTSTWAHGLGAGDDVQLEGPFGTFVPAPERQGPVLLLGAGSGLAPLRALAESLHGRRPVTLFFSARGRKDLIDARAFEQWQQTEPEFRYLFTLTRETGHRWQGRLPPLLSPALGNLEGWEVFASGPSGFVVGCAAAARALGAAASDVHTEEFFVDPAPWLGQKPPLPAPAGNPEGKP